MTLNIIPLADQQAEIDNARDESMMAIADLWGIPYEMIQGDDWISTSSIYTVPEVRGGIDPRTLEGECARCFECIQTSSCTKCVYPRCDVCSWPLYINWCSWCDAFEQAHGRLPTADDVLPRSSEQVEEIPQELAGSAAE